MTRELWVPPRASHTPGASGAISTRWTSRVFLIREPCGATTLCPTRDDAQAGFILSANHCRDRELVLRYWLVQRDTVQTLFSDRLAVEEAPQRVRQANTTYIPPIRPFVAVRDIALCRIVVGIGQARWRAIVSKRERRPSVGLLVSEADCFRCPSFQLCARIGACKTQGFRDKRCKIPTRRGVQARVELPDRDRTQAQVSQQASLSVGDFGVSDPMRPRIDHVGVHYDAARA